MSEEYKPGMMGAWPQSILVVEDERTMRMIIKRIIMRLGVPCVREASDGGRALTILKDTPVDLVVTDWSMPSINGIELLYLMHQDEELKDIPVLFLTARTDVRSVEQAIGAGANGYIVKPFTPALLEHKLKEMFVGRLRPEGR
jgi:two-component system, chemotaxis family, chemotaxis protein CheY